MLLNKRARAKLLIFSTIKDGILRLTDYNGTVLSMDLEGRVLIYATNKITYRRTLQNRYFQISYNDGKRAVKMLGFNEGREIARGAFEFAKSCRNEVDNSSIRAALDYIIGKGPSFLEDDARKLNEIYEGEIPIVPPDQYFPVYLQATTGCYWNNCTFCNLYRGKKYGVKSFDEFRYHIQKVKEFFGKGLAARRTIFLGDANAIVINQDLLKRDLLAINQEIKLPIYSFVDSITTQKVKDMAALQEIGELGLKRLYLGLESGSREILKLLNKPMDLNEAQRFIINIKRAGISIGIITLAGAGGKKYYREHVESTSEFISLLPLDRNDIIFISPLYIYPNLPYAEISQELGVLTRHEEEMQYLHLREKIKEKYLSVQGFELSSPIALYDLIESVY